MGIEPLKRRVEKIEEARGTAPPRGEAESKPEDLVSLLPFEDLDRHRVALRAGLGEARHPGEDPPDVPDVLRAARVPKRPPMRGAPRAPRGGLAVLGLQDVVGRSGGPMTIEARRAIVRASYRRHGLKVLSWLADGSAVPLRCEKTRPRAMTPALAWRSAARELRRRPSRPLNARDATPGGASG